MIIREYRPADESAVYEVCLRTGADGQDATSSYADPMLLGHAYAGAYLRLQPEYAFVLDDTGLGGPHENGDVAGYVLGALDTREFERHCEREWWPALRTRYPDPVGVPPEARTPDQRLIHMFHHPVSASAALLDGHPSHLHIDLLPRAQGQGFGRKLMDLLLTELAAAGSPGVHLGVSATNTGAIAFYRRLGFERLAGDPYTVFMGRRL
ncbi:GNAT family N-acetyltransferase [Actinomadura scrupuli]|uniref:GNAT family N-acetyltransferase n=1 Tax=Actinomadura scrupuli TaxID=559629 RepID=UPI003D960637